MAGVIIFVLPANPVQSDAVGISDVSQVQIHLFHWVAAMIIKCRHVGTFDGAKLRSPTQNRPVHYTCSTAGGGSDFRDGLTLYFHCSIRSRCLTESLSLWIPQVIQGLDVVSVVHIVRILFRGEIEATDPHVVWQEQHWRVS